MDRNEVTQKIIGAKVRKGLKWKDIADRLGQSKEWSTAACLGQMTFSKAQAEVAQGLFELTDEEAAATYMFNKHVIKHRFCKVCGIHAFGEGVDPKGNAMAAINVRCLEGIDLESVPVHKFDGRSKP